VSSSETGITNPPRRDERLRSWLLVIGFCAVIAAVYSASAGNGFVYDDYEVILRQPKPANSAEILEVFQEPHFCELPYYRPVTRATLLLQKFLHGDSPRPFHLFNIALAIIAFLLARAVLRLPGLHIRPAAALAGAFLFAVHPVTSACVYPIASGRETLLPGVLVLGAFYAFLQPGRGARLVSWLLFTLAIFSKESAVMALPLMIAADALGIGPWRHSTDWRRWLSAYVPFGIAIVAYFLIRLSLFEGREYDLAVIDRPFGPVLSFVFALQALFAPFLALVYEPRPAIWASFPRLIVTAIGLALLVKLALLLRARRGSSLVCFWVLWFVLLFLPTSNLLHQETPFAERYGFPAILGIIGLVAGALSQVQIGIRLRSAVTALVIVMACALAGITWHRARYYEDSAAFCRQWLRTDPSAVNAHTHLGFLALEEDDSASAAAQLERALELAPDHVGARVLLAATRLKMGSAEAAIALASEALALDSRSADARSVLAEALAQGGRTEDAVHQYRELLKRAPARVDARFNLAVLLFELGRTEETIAEYSKLLQDHRDHAAAKGNLGRALAAEGRLAEAVVQYREALRLDPDDPRTHGNLANILAVQGHNDEARTHYREVLRLDARSAEAHFNLAMLAASQRSFGEARDHLVAAGDLRPGWHEPTLRLAWMLSTCADDGVRNPEEAVRLAEGVCRDVGWSVPRSLDTLAAAYAAADRFDDAARAARRALEYAESGGDDSITAQIRRRLTLYESGRAYVEEY